MASTPSVTVVVSHLDSARTISKCIDCLLGQDYPPTKYEVLVVDGGSTDSSKRIVESFGPRVRQIVAEGSSESRGQIIGVNSSDSEVVMFTNSDIYVPPGWISRHISWLSSGFDYVGGRVLWGGDKLGFAWNSPAPTRPQHLAGNGLSLGFSNCSFRRRLFDSSGGLVEMESQHDAEFVQRLASRGVRFLLDPEIEVYHDHPMKSLSNSLRHSWAYAENHMILMRAENNGRLVARTRASVVVSARSFLEDWLLVRPTRAYVQQYPKVVRYGIKVGLLEFLFLWLLSTKLGSTAGTISGIIKRDVSVRDIGQTRYSARQRFGQTLGR